MKNFTKYYTLLDKSTEMTRENYEFVKSKIREKYDGEQLKEMHKKLYARCNFSWHALVWKLYHDCDIVDFIIDNVKPKALHAHITMVVVYAIKDIIKSDGVEYDLL